MNGRIDEILGHIQTLEDELQAELSQRKESLAAHWEQKRVQFEKEILEQQKKFKVGLVKYIWTAEFRSVLAIPFIYSLIVPLVMLDLFISLYQAVCFPLFKIKKAKRRDHFVFDRSALAYLNFLEKINCAYCSYGNGLISYAREIAGKTEQYWCPIKHQKRIFLSHPYYKKFSEYGDAQSYQEDLKRLRDDLAQIAAQGEVQTKVETKVETKVD